MALSTLEPKKVLKKTEDRLKATIVFCLQHLQLIFYLKTIRKNQKVVIMKESATN